MMGQTQIRIRNLLKIYQMLFRGPLTRHTLMECSGLSLMSVTNLTNKLLRSDVVELTDTDKPENKFGRRAEAVALKTEEPVWVVLDLRSSMPSYTLFTADRRNYSSRSIEGADYGKGFEGLLKQIGDLKRQYALRGAAAITPGPYDPDKDRVNNIRIPLLNEIPLRETLCAALGVDCYIEEDVKLSATACAEHYTEADSLYYLFVGDGVGGAFVNSGSLVSGLNSLAGDPGQLPCGGDTFENLLNTAAWREALKTMTEDEVIARNARIAKSLIDIIIGILDPHAIIIDCVYLDKETGRRFVGETRSLLSYAGWRKLPYISAPDFSEQVAFLGAIKNMEQRWITRLVNTK
ncbi:MAG: ROK family protein [Abditibacteriota bacterium]|nr:ROK family protein [Abditibacteriota bacterium]